MKRDKIFGIIRHILTFAGGIIVLNGHIDDSMLQEIIGASMSIIGLVASIFDKDKGR